MTFDRLKWAASTGLDLSPGDPVAAWAVAEIERLRALLAMAEDCLPDGDYSLRVMAAKEIRSALDET